ncbi:alpha-amylase family protein [Azospirillum halopraeferens]|uniref:alpha-amylase family protein n=1 Tax=Azospirillum halopraeferens TaxID=34010 RepID=UPI0003F7F96F|nr:alpha-amylase family protein [Azospirillum halopraeferens]
MINDLWYKNAVVYCLSVGTFMDANGDGIGDFKGLLRRLDYLQGLGVTTLWLMPFQPSPRRDHGYDITDHYGVDPRYGSLGDFVEFAHAARQRGLRIIMDLVINHTSDRHPWFRAARKDPRSPFRDFYIWSDTKPEDAHEGMVFPGVQNTTWTRDPVAGAYYFHRFYDFQPDLNIGNPEVQAELLKIMGFWLELGVSGFRIDAVPFVIERQGAEVKEERPRYDLLRFFRAFAQWRRGDVVLLAEANVPPRLNVEYFGEDGDRMHMMFNFPVNQSLFLALATGDARPLVAALEETRGKPDSAQWASFLRNHDELDLGRLSDEERDAVFAAFAPDPDMQLYGRGIRRRLAAMLDGDPRRLHQAYSLLFTLPGTPVLYYGDEIGMGDDLSLKERDSVRTPMQWSPESCGGFTAAERPVRPVISGGAFGYERVNVAMQRRDPESLFNWMERIIGLRKECPEIGWGTMTVLNTGNPAVLGLRYDWRNNTIVCLHNLAAKPCEITIRTGGDDDSPCLINLLSEEHSRAGDDGRHCILLEGHGFRWFRQGGLDDVLRRTDL